MSSKEPLNKISTISLQFSEMISEHLQTFNKRLCAVENGLNSIKNWEHIINDLQTAHSKSIERIQSIENKLSDQFQPSNRNVANNGNEQAQSNQIPNKPALSSMETIDETQNENINNQNVQNTDNEQQNEMREMAEKDIFSINLNPITLLSPLQKTQSINDENTSPPMHISSSNHNHKIAEAVSPHFELSTSPRAAFLSSTNQKMPTLELGTMNDQNCRFEKENIPPINLQNDDENDPLHLLGLDTQSVNIEENENMNDNNLDIDVLFSSFECCANSAQASMKNNDFKTALEHLKDGFDEFNKYKIDIPANKLEIVSIAYCNKAICCAKTQKYDDAFIAIHKCIELRPKWAKAYSTKAAICAYSGNDNDAINAYKESLELCQKNSNEYNKYEQRLKNIFLRQKREQNNMENLNNRKRKSSEISMIASPAKRTKISVDERIKSLQSRLCSKTVSELQIMLEMNEQKKSGKKDELLQRVIDGIINGAIPKCPKCPKEGRGNKSFLKFNASTGYYECNGGFDVNANKRMPCDFCSNSLQRKPWITHKYSR